MKRVMLAGIVLALASLACGGSDELAATPTAIRAATAVPATVVAPSATPTSASTATPTITPGVTATATVVPTVTPSPTAMASATPEMVEVDLSGWQAPLMVGAMTLAMVQEMEDTAAGLQAGTMESVEAGGQLMAFGITLGLLAQTLEESTLTGAPAGYRQPLQDNMAALYQVIDRWQQGEITSATVPGELAAVRAASERTLAAMMDDLRALGVPQENLDEFMAEVMAGL